MEEEPPGEMSGNRGTSSAGERPEPERVVGGQKGLRGRREPRVTHASGGLFLITRGQTA